MTKHQHVECVLIKFTFSSLQIKQARSSSQQRERLYSMHRKGDVTQNARFLK